MKFSTATATAFLASMSLVAASPVPGIHTVMVTHYHTVINTITAGAPQQTQTTQQTTQQTAETTAAAPEQAETTSAETTAAAPEQAETSSAETTAAAPEQAETTSAVTSEAPSPNTTPQFPTTSTPAATSTSTSSTSSSSTTSSTPSSSGSDEEHHGDGTYYDTGMGACGETSTDDDKIVAISQQVFDEKSPNGNPNKNSYCGKTIRATYQGKSVDVKVVDSCPGCAKDSLDLSPSAFSQIADKDLGRIKLSWKWVD